MRPTELSLYPLVESTMVIVNKSWTVTTVRDQDALIRGVQTDRDLANFPYGLMLWASAIGLAERIARQPELVRGKRILELGAGVGLAGIIAQSLGGLVTQTDYQTDALALARHNADQNMVKGMSYRQGDWRNFPDDLIATAFDIVIGSDILYERGLHDDLAMLLPRLVAPSGLLILSDPLRPQSLTFIERIEKASNLTIQVEGCCASWDGETKDIALFFIRNTSGVSPTT